MDIVSSSGTFPDVTEIIIGRDVFDIKIENLQFPNVREITSYSCHFPSGSMLMRKMPGFTYCLLNTFCLSENEVVNLSNVSSINALAFKGCESEHIINTESIEYVKSNAFYGSKYLEQSCVNGINNIYRYINGRNPYYKIYICH